MNLVVAKNASVMLFFIVLVIYLVIQKLEYYESFTSLHPWNNHLSSRIIGKTWKYDGPTTRVEYEFVEHKPLSDKTVQKIKIAPVTHNSYYDKGLKCKNI